MAHEDGTGASFRSAPARAPRLRAGGSPRDDGRQVKTGNTLARRPLRAGQGIAPAAIRASEGREHRDDRPRPERAPWRTSAGKRQGPCKVAHRHVCAPAAEHVAICSVASRRLMLAGPIEDPAIGSHQAMALQRGGDDQAPRAEPTRPFFVNTICPSRMSSGCAEARIRNGKIAQLGQPNVLDRRQFGDHAWHELGSFDLIHSDPLFNRTKTDHMHGIPDRETSIIAGGLKNGELLYS